MDHLLHIQTEEIQTDGSDNFHFHRYEPTSYDVIKNLFEYYTPAPEDVLVDYGCGLGRLNFYVEYMFGIRSVGVEFSEEYYRRAQKNLDTYIGAKERITFCKCRAEEYEVESDQTIFYFFNPFSIAVFRRVINQILKSWQEHPRKVILILYYPEDDVVFYLERHTIFRLIDEIAAGENIRSNRREKLCIYSLT